MATSNTSASTEQAVATDDEFDAILNQLNELGSSIDQELSSNNNKTAAISTATTTLKDSSSGVSFGSGGSMQKKNANNNTAAMVVNDTDTMRHKSNYQHHHHQSDVTRASSNTTSSNSTPPTTTTYYDAFHEYKNESSHPSQHTTLDPHHNHLHHNSDLNEDLHHHHHHNFHLSYHHQTNGIAHHHLRTDSPDNDSAFSDSISLISTTEQCTSSGSSTSTNSSPTDSNGSTGSGSNGSSSSNSHHRTNSHQNHLASNVSLASANSSSSGCSSSGGGSSGSGTSLPLPPPPSPLPSSIDVIAEQQQVATTPTSSCHADNNGSTTVVNNTGAVNITTTTTTNINNATATTSSSISSTSSLSLDRQISSVITQQELFFEQLGQVSANSATGGGQEATYGTAGTAAEGGGGGGGVKGGGVGSNNDESLKLDSISVKSIISTNNNNNEEEKEEKKAPTLDQTQVFNDQSDKRENICLPSPSPVPQLCTINSFDGHQSNDDEDHFINDENDDDIEQFALFLNIFDQTQPFSLLPPPSVAAASSSVSSKSSSSVISVNCISDSDNDDDDDDDDGDGNANVHVDDQRKLSYQYQLQYSSELLSDSNVQQQQLHLNFSTSSTQKEDQQTSQLIEDQIQMAIEKIREANIRKLYIKVFAQDNSAKSLLADERMTIGAICRQLAEKNHMAMDRSLCIIEHMPTLYLERFYEDHESLVDNVLLWGRDTSNKLYFMQRNDKYDLFIHPEKYLIGSVTNVNNNVNTNTDGVTGNGDRTLTGTSSLHRHHGASQSLRSDLIAKFFALDSPSHAYHHQNSYHHPHQPFSGLTRSNSTSSATVRVPEIEGQLYLRTEGKKSWKKYFFSLRTSGLYYCTKGKPKSTKDLLCLTTFELNCVYLGFGWKKKFKAPNDYGFAIKHPQVQTKSPKQIKYLCAETEEDLRLWLTGIRIAKYGRQLWENYEQLQRDECAHQVHLNQLHQSSSSDTSKDIPNGSKRITSTTAALVHHNDTPVTLSPAMSLANGIASHNSVHSQYPQSHMNNVTMRSNRVTHDDSARSSSTSSTSSGCLSESGQSSVVSNSPSTGSGNSSVSNQGPHHHHHHHNHHHAYYHQQQQYAPAGTSMLEHHNSVQHLYLSNGTSSVPASPSHASSIYASSQNLQQSSNGGNVGSSSFDADFPLGGTIKRKPSVPMMPKIPLTSTTRNLALQSDDALLEVNDADAGGGGQNRPSPSPSHDNSTSPHHGDNHHHQDNFYGTTTAYSGSAEQSLASSSFIRGTFKNNTLRRSNTEERIKSEQRSKQLADAVASVISANQSPSHQIYQQQQKSLSVSPPLPFPPPLPSAITGDEDDLPPPPPPLSEVSGSTLSLNGQCSANNSNITFPPPPPPEMLNNSVTSQQLPSPTSVPSIQSAISAPNTTATTATSSHYQSFVLMTPQPKPKNAANRNGEMNNGGSRLSRRLSDLSGDSTFFHHHQHNNYRNGVNNGHLQSSAVEFPAPYNESTYGGIISGAPHSRASIATPSSGMMNMHGYLTMPAGVGFNGVGNNETASTSNLYGSNTAFATLKPFHQGGSTRATHHQRHMTLDLHSHPHHHTLQHQHSLSGLSSAGANFLQKYGTSPRIRNETGPSANLRHHPIMASALTNGVEGANIITAPPQACSTRPLAATVNDAIQHPHSSLPSASSSYQSHNAAPAINGFVPGQTQPASSVNAPILGSMAIPPPPPPSVGGNPHCGLVENGLSNGGGSAGVYGSKINEQQQYGVSNQIQQNSSNYAQKCYPSAVPLLQGNGDCYPQQNGNVFAGNLINTPSMMAQQPSSCSTMAPSIAPPPVPHSIPARSHHNASKESHYSSISPHLLQKHQQMQQQQQHQQQPTMNQSSTGLPPEQIFLKNMERVMAKKWHVAQMLRQDHYSDATPGQVLGFRETAYRPPPPPGEENIPRQQQQQLQQQFSIGSQINNGSVPGSPNHHHHHYTSQHLYQAATAADASSLPFYHHHQQQQQSIYGAPNGQNPRTGTKSVRIADTSPTILGTPSTIATAQQSHYGTSNANSSSNSSSSLNRKVPPPPPKRSDSTHLTTTTTSNGIGNVSSSVSPSLSSASSSHSSSRTTLRNY